MKNKNINFTNSVLAADLQVPPKEFKKDCPYKDSFETSRLINRAMQATGFA